MPQPANHHVSSRRMAGSSQASHANSSVNKCQQVSCIRHIHFRPVTHTHCTHSHSRARQSTAPAWRSTAPSGEHRCALPTCTINTHKVMPQVPPMHRKNNNPQKPSRYPRLAAPTINTSTPYRPAANTAKPETRKWPSGSKKKLHAPNPRP